MAWAALDGGLAAALPSISMPLKLYENHPARRYQKCFLITPQELAECQAFAQKMEDTVIYMMIDGLISD